MGRSLKKGPFVNAKHQDMVKTINNIPPDGGTHYRSA